PSLPPPPGPWSCTVVPGAALPSPPLSPPPSFEPSPLELSDDKSITNAVLLGERPMKALGDPCRPKRSCSCACTEGAVIRVSAVKSGGAAPNPVTKPRACAGELSDRLDCVNVPVSTT